MWSDNAGSAFTPAREADTAPLNSSMIAATWNPSITVSITPIISRAYEKKVRADEREAWPTPMAGVHQVLRPVPSQDGGRYLRCHQTAFPPDRRNATGAPIVALLASGLLKDFP